MSTVIPSRPRRAGSRRRTAGLALAIVCLVTALLGVSVPASAAAGTPRPCSRGLVALTFDDGPATGVTGRLIDRLSRQRVPATFFVVGSRVSAAPAPVRTAFRRGFVIANHTYGHELLTSLSDDGIRATLRRTAAALRHARVRPTRLVRPPYGGIDSRVRAVVDGMGLTPVLWDIDPRDWQSGTSADIRARVLGALRPGGSNIVLLHDGVARSPVTLGAVPGIIRGARARGYCFAALGPGGRPTPPVPRTRVSNATVTEADPGHGAALVFTLSLDRPTSRRTSVRVRTVDGSAGAGTDYRALLRRVEFPAGTQLRQVTVRVRGDRVDERRERLRLRLARPRGLTIADGTGLGTIRDDDPAPRVRLSGTSVTEPAEGSATGVVAVRIDRPRSRRIGLVLTTVPGTADETDYEPFQLTRTIPAGQLAIEVPVTVLADELEETEEVFAVQVLSATGARIVRGTATVTIAPPPPPPPPNIR